LVVFVSDMFAENYTGGAELTSEAIIIDSLIPVVKVHSRTLTTEIMENNKDKFWVFGNFADLTEDCIMFAIKNLQYSILEYDYKYCIYRSPEKHILATGSCNCHNERRGKLVSIFYKMSKITWFMSESQKNIYLDKFSFLKNNSRVLSSVFSQDKLDFIESLDTNNKNNKWIILDSNSWVKGKQESLNVAKEKNLDYELVSNLKHEDFLKKLASSKGLIYTPPGNDTCPRMIIEAKLLGCKLILNDNVQHKEESWFETRESIYSYMRERTSVFWSSIEDSWNIDTPKHEPSNKNKFNIIVPFYNASSWVRKCIKSIKSQKHTNFSCYIIDDMSTDNSDKIIEKEIENDNRFVFIKNKSKKYALGNIVDTLLQYCNEEEDINILLDGDDWFSSVNVLSYLDQVYEKSNCLVTYGSYVYYPNGQRGVEPSKYSNEVIENNGFRKDKWRASHLRTFKTKAWKQIDLKDLKCSEGKYYKMAYDQALMLPLLEICGDRIHFVDKILHVYNRQNPLNVDKIKQKEQFLTAQKIRSKKSYKRVF